MKRLIKVMNKEHIDDDKFLVALVNTTPNRDITTFINKLFDSTEDAELYVERHNKISDSFKTVVIYRLQGYAVYVR